LRLPGGLRVADRPLRLRPPPRGRDAAFAVLFRVSGTISLKRSLTITRPFITIAGHTAPGDGMCLNDYALTIGADEVVVRHLRVRPGHGAGKELDSISVWRGRNIILAHCSASWSVDETLSVTRKSCDDIRIGVWRNGNRLVHRCQTYSAKEP